MIRIFSFSFSFFFLETLAEKETGKEQMNKGLLWIQGKEKRGQDYIITALAANSNAYLNFEARGEQEEGHYSFHIR